MAEIKEKYYFSILAIVAIVAIVGFVTMFIDAKTPMSLVDSGTNAISPESAGNIGGEAYRFLRTKEIKKEEVKEEPTNNIIPPSKVTRSHLSTTSIDDAINCTDSDGGDNPYERGHVTLYYDDTYESPTQYYGDYCQNSYRVNERYCDGNTLVTAGRDCEFGCAEGRCFNHTIFEPRYDSHVTGYKYQFIDSEGTEYQWADILLSAYNYDSDASIYKEIACYDPTTAHKLFAGHRSYSSDDDIDNDGLGQGSLGLQFKTPNGDSFEYLECEASLEYGPYSYDQEIFSEGLFFPEVHQLVIMQEWGSDDYYINVVASTQGQIDVLKMGYGVETETSGNGASVSVNYDEGTSSINEMIPISIADDVTHISLEAGLYQAHPSLRTFAFKDYYLDQPSPTMVEGRDGKRYRVIEGSERSLTFDQAVKKVQEAESAEI